VKKTQPQDWEEGSRPIAWPSAREQEEFLGLSDSQVKHLNRILFEAGVFVMRDNEQGKRYGRRGPDKKILEAFGFDLSPLAQRYDEFVRIAGEARATLPNGFPAKWASAAACGGGPATAWAANMRPWRSR
jgi:replication initiation protein RepC